MGEIIGAAAFADNLNGILSGGYTFSRKPMTSAAQWLWRCVAAPKDAG